MELYYLDNSGFVLFLAQAAFVFGLLEFSAECGGCRIGKRLFAG